MPRSPRFITRPLSCRNVTVPNRRISTKPTTKTIETAPPGWATALLRAIQPILGRSRSLLAQPFRTDGRRFAQSPFRPLSCGPLRPLDPPHLPHFKLLQSPRAPRALTREWFGICFFSFLLTPSHRTHRSRGSLVTHDPIVHMLSEGLGGKCHMKQITRY